MTREEHLLTILAEECNEVGQRCAKALRFGAEEIQATQELTNAQRIMSEYAHILAAVEMLQDSGMLPPVDRAEVFRKKQAVEEWLGYSEKLGRVEKGEGS